MYNSAPEIVKFKYECLAIDFVTSKIHYYHPMIFLCFRLNWSILCIYSVITLWLTSHACDYLIPCIYSTVLLPKNIFSIRIFWNLCWNLSDQFEAYGWLTVPLGARYGRGSTLPRYFGVMAREVFLTRDLLVLLRRLLVRSLGI